MGMYIFSTNLDLYFIHPIKYSKYLYYKIKFKQTINQTGYLFRINK